MRFRQGCLGLLLVITVGVAAIGPASRSADAGTVASAALAFPGPATTGVPPGTVLTQTAGHVVTTAGAVLDELDIAGTVVIDAPDVTINRSRIRGQGDGYGILVRSGDVTIYDSEIYNFENGIAFDNWRAYRVDLHHLTQDGVKLGSNVILADSWIHDLTPERGAHADGAQMQNGIVNTVVRHNTIDSRSPNGGYGNAALFLVPTLGPNGAGPLIVADNLLAGGNYTLFCLFGGSRRYQVRNISIVGNRFVQDSSRYGAAYTNMAFVQVQNVWHQTGLPVLL